jgi:hypothetical protein
LAAHADKKGFPRYEFMNRCIRAVLPIALTLITLTLTLGPPAGHAQTGPDSGLQLLGTIPLEHVDGRIDQMAASPDGRWLFVAAQGGNRVVKVDTQAARVSAVIKVRSPRGICYLPKSQQVAVASAGSGDLQFYTDTLKPLGTVRGLDEADNLRYDADANLVYAGYGDGALAVIDPQMAVQTAKIPLDGHPESFQLESHGTRVFINVPATGEIEVFDRANRRLLNEWKLKDAADSVSMALDEADKRLFIGTRKPARILVLETEAGKELAMLSACGDTDDLFFDESNRFIYLSGGQGCVSVFQQADSVTYNRMDTVSTFPGARSSLLVPQAQRLYVAVPHRGAQRSEIMVFATQ